MELYGYDIEVFPNYAVFVFVNGDDYSKIYSETKHLNAVRRKEELSKAKNFKFRIGLGYNDIARLVSFVNRNIYLAGFNILGYDNIIINACISRVNYWKSVKEINRELYNLSQLIIANQRAEIYNDPKITVYKYMNTLYSSIDVQTLFYLNKVKKSLKQTLINLNWADIEDYEMPKINDRDRHFYKKQYPDEVLNTIEPWDRYVISDYIPGIESYCLNDTLGVLEIIMQKIKEVKLRFNITNKYGIDVLSASKSTIADRLFGQFYMDKARIDHNTYKNGRTYRDFISVGNCIPYNVEFHSKELKSLYDKLSRDVIRDTKGELSYSVEFDGTLYKLGTGGLHSSDNPGIIRSTDEYKILDADVTSYYPMLVRMLNIAPAHLDSNIFIDTTSTIVDERVAAKAKGDKTTSDTLKIVINSGIFGKMGFDGPVKDDEAMVKVTIAGQLYLLMLIEMLSEEGIKTLSANTDGVVCKVPIEKQHIYNVICKRWMDKVNLNLEFAEYELYVRRDVNSYFAVYTGEGDPMDRIKLKGSLNPNLYLEDLTKGYNKPIVAKAILNYYLYDKPIMDTLKECKDIFMFVGTQKPDGKFNMKLRTIQNRKYNVVNLTKNVRFYVSKGNNNMLSGILVKTKDKVITPNSRFISVIARKEVTIFNRAVIFDNFDDYHIDYSYYYDEVMKIVKRINTGVKKLNDAKKVYGQHKLNL